MVEPKPFANDVVSLADTFKKAGWVALLRNTNEPKYGSGSCHKCRKQMVMPGIFGLGLHYCTDCKVAVKVSPFPSSRVNRAVEAYWDGNLYAASLYELVEIYRDRFQEIAISTGLIKKLDESNNKKP